MHRAILTLLVGLMLSLGGGGSAIGMPHDDETVCSRATSGAPPVWSSINLLYVEEAVKRGLTCGVGNTTNASLNETKFNQKQILMASEFIDANKNIFQSSQIVKIQLQGDFKGKNGSYKTTYHGFATENEIFVSSSWGRGFKVIYGSANTKSTTQVLKGWDFVEKPKKDKASVSFTSKTNGSFFEILADGHFSGFKNWSTRVPGNLQLARPINVFLQKRTVSGLRNTVSVQGADSVRREVTRRIKLFRELEKTRKKYEQRAKENGVFSPNFGKNNTKVIAQLLELEEQLKGLSEQFKTQMASLEPVPKKLGVAEVQVPKNVTAGVGSSPINGTTPKLRDLIARNSALLKETEIYSSLLSASLSTSSKSWDETWGVIVMHDQVLAFKLHQKGKKFVFGVQYPATPLRLEGYEYYAPNNNMAKISLSGDWTKSFIAAVANRDTFSGHVNWSGKWRQKIELKAASSSASIKSDPHYDQKISEVIEPEILLKLINARIKKLQRLKELQRDFEAFLSKKGVLQASVGKDITPKVQELQRFKKNLTDLIQNDVLMVANEKAVGSDDTVNEITTAKPKDERKAKEAEAQRLAKLDEERKAKEAEARRLAKLEEERKAKEAEARRLAKLEEERKAKEAEARRLAKLEEERKAKEAEARRLAKLQEERKAKEAEARRLAEADKSPPQIFAEVVSQDGYDALIRGVITDDTGLQDIAMNGQLLEVDEQGVFETSVYIPRGGELLVIEALDKMGKLSRFELPLERKQVAKLQLASFEKLSPSNRRAKLNQNAVAVIIGVAEYQRTEVPAVYADEDAKFFYDYATLKLGVPEQNIIELVNDKANEIEIALAIENFLKRRIKRNQTDVYIFFAGHGLATDDGSEMYLLPYDGAPQLLERTAISRKQLFNDIAASNPKSVTVFLDTCYSGTTRGTETLIASRPIAIKARQQDIPEGFTVMTAAAGDQTAKPLEEAKHGMFSYFLMKGMEGDADANQDNQITAGELHAYVQQNVIQQSSGSQTPQLQGDADRVLVRFQ